MQSKWLRAPKPKMNIPTFNKSGEPDPNGGPNRAERRNQARGMKRMTRHPDACMTLEHGLLQTPTRYGLKLIKSRRHSAAIAKAGRKIEQNKARLLRVKRQKRSRVAANG